MKVSLLTTSSSPGAGASWTSLIESSWSKVLRSNLQWPRRSAMGDVDMYNICGRIATACEVAVPDLDKLQIDSVLLHGYHFVIVFVLSFIFQQIKSSPNPKCEK